MNSILQQHKEGEGGFIAHSTRFSWFSASKIKVNITISLRIRTGDEVFTGKKWDGKGEKNLK